MKEQLEKILGMDINRFDRKFIASVLKTGLKNIGLVRETERIVKKYTGESLAIRQDTAPIIAESKSYKIEDGRIYLSGLSDKDSSVVNAIPGRLLNHKSYSVPYNDYSIKTLNKIGFNVLRETAIVSKSVNLALPEGLQLRPFQAEDVTRMLSLNGKILLANEPRTGKTCEVLSFLYTRKDIRPAVIIVPATLKIQWSREIAKWLPGETCRVITGKASQTITESIVVINYDILSDHLEELITLNPKILIMDECHMAKSSSANRVRAAKYLNRRVPHIIAMSGTPIVNRPIEFYNVLNMIAPTVFNSREKFMARYCNYPADPSGKGASNTKELYEVLSSTFMIRRTRKEVLPQLPPIERQIIPMEINNRGEYELAKSDFINYVREKDGDYAAIRASFAETIVKINRLRKLSIEGKMTQIIDWIEEFLENDEKLIVIGIHRDTIDTLFEHFKDISVKIYGGMSAKQKDNSANRFQTDSSVKLFLGNIRSAGVGLPLHAASAVATVELDWVPGNHDQAEDRMIDMNKTDNCTSYYLIGFDTIEEDLAHYIDRKRHVLSNVLDGETPVDENLLVHLIDKYKNVGR